MTHDEIRSRHFKRLNSYRHSADYAEYARQIGGDFPVGELPSLLGDRWGIDEETYDDFLGMLPPLGWHGGSFYMMEFLFGDITTKCSKEGNRYFCEFARYTERRSGP